MPHPTFHFAILGLGNIARKFAQDLALIDDAKLVAVGSRSMERAQAFAQDFKVSWAAGCYADTFGGPRVDAVYIATPHVTHLELTIMCLERGIPVICEKPMGLNLAQVEQVVRVAGGTQSLPDGSLVDTVSALHPEAEGNNRLRGDRYH